MKNPVTDKYVENVKKKKIFLLLIKKVYFKQNT